MDRCKDCAEICESTQCARCRHYEWTGMQRQMQEVREQKDAINAFNSMYWRKKKLKKDLIDGAKVAILILMVIALVANGITAWDYEYTKIERIRQLTTDK